MSGVDRWGKSYAILADGCSGSPDTDFGSRFLVRSALWALNQVKEPGFPASGIHTTAISLASQMASSCNVDFGCLDATLLMAVEGESQDRKGVWVSVFGDGMVVARHRDTKHQAIYSFDFASGYPAYLSYVLDIERLKAYVKHTQGLPATLNIFGHEGSVSTPFPFFDLSATYWTNPFCVFFPEDKFDVVALFSDGIESFEKMKDGDPSLSEADMASYVSTVAGEFMSFKGCLGEFVVRRAKKAITKFREMGYTHADDFSMAAIHMG